MNSICETEESPTGHDVVIVGGGPAGCSAGVFTAGYGLDTVIFDRGRSSTQRCAHLENYLGFPAGIDVETLYGLIHDHAKQAGCEIVSNVVESVVSADDVEGFTVETQESRRVTAGRVVAATRYDGEYLRPLVKDVRQERGYPPAVADRYDWMRQESELNDEWSDRDRWREWFDGRLPDDHDLSEERRVDLREMDIDRRFDEYISPEEIEQRAERSQDRLLEHIDDDRILEHAQEIEVKRESSGVND